MRTRLVTRSPADLRVAPHGEAAPLAPAAPQGEGAGEAGAGALGAGTPGAGAAAGTCPA
ncbi:hypothetical protein [Streptomyces bicolor]|uniref:hypothetical protein n=1 Tax=Streptomyces bicolor TaxID=66874 RepID=UPI00131A8465|nr:hypothetical protein [Streptomyces bicolor]